MESADLLEVYKRLAGKLNFRNPAYLARRFKEVCLMQEDEFDLVGVREILGIPPKQRTIQ